MASTRIRLRYSGAAVDEGSMPIDEVVEALEGFSGAYTKIAGEFDTTMAHQLRVTALDKGSFDVGILASTYLASGGDLLRHVESAVDAAKFVVGLLSKVIQTKKHVKGKSFNVSVKGDNNTLIVINAEGATLEVPREVVTIINDKLIDTDLKKIADPLEPTRIESAEVIANEGSKDELRTRIESNEKGYFRPPEGEPTSGEIEVVGKLVSLNKERNKGTFKLQNNETIQYRFIGDNKEKFYTDFSHQGSVKVTGIADFNESLSPVRINIKTVEPVQDTLSLRSSESSDK